MIYILMLTWQKFSLSGTTVIAAYGSRMAMSIALLCAKSVSKYITNLLVNQRFPLPQINKILDILIHLIYN